MANLLAISEAASLAIHTMALLAKHPDRHVATTELAETLGASEHTLAKALQRLTRAGLLDSVRGPHGGFVLAKGTENITLLEIYEAIEGPIGKPTCLLGSPACSGSECILGDMIHSVNMVVRDGLAKTTLAQLASHLPISLPEAC
jgi:Rrf2 family protein